MFNVSCVQGFSQILCGLPSRMTVMVLGLNPGPPGHNALYSPAMDSVNSEHMFESME